MNSEEKLKAAITRRIDDTYSEGVDGIHERLDDDAILASAFIERHVFSESAPKWRDKPTCAGLWAFPAKADKGSWCVQLFEIDLADRRWQRSCFGPIPTEPAT